MNVARVDFQKTYHMAPYHWILKTLEPVGAATNMVELPNRSMQSWRMVLFSGRYRLQKVNIKQGVFQGDSLSPLFLQLL